jgi:hypothetical protein
MTAATLVRSLVLGSVVAALAGCAHRGPAPLYLWDTFPRMQYDALLKNGVSPMEQIEPMEAQAEKARAAGAALPPGFRAHLGMLKLAAGNPDQARALWLAEEAAFPESTPYMNQLLKRLDGPSEKDKPA